MKKTFALILCVVMICSLCMTACGRAAAPTTEPTPVPESVPTTEAAPAAEAEVPMAGTIIVGAHEVGTGGYTNVALQIEGISEVFPDLKIKALPSGTESTRAYYARLGEAQAFCTGGLTP